MASKNGRLPQHDGETSAAQRTSIVTAAIVRYYRVSILVVAALLIYGLWVFLSLPRSEDPEFDVLDCHIVTLFPGAIAEKVESLVTRPIEEALEEMDEIETTESHSYGGLSVVHAYLRDDVVPADVVELIQRRVRNLQPQLPKEAREPEVQGYNLGNVPVAIAALSGPDDYRLLDRWARSIRDQLSVLEGIARVEIEGMPERQIVVEVDNERLAQYGLPLIRIGEILSLENAAIPGGKLEVGRYLYLLENPNEFKSLRDIETTVVGSYVGSVVLLRDVAQVEDSFEDPRYLVRANGRSALLLTVAKHQKVNTVAVAERVREKVGQLQDALPEGLELRLISDQGLSVAGLLGNLGRNALAGGIVVVLVVTLFLGIRQAAVVSVTIPLSILIAIVLMRWNDIDLNQVSIFGLVLALGMLVDSGLVVVENIGRHLEEGKSLFRAVATGVDEVRAPVLSSTLTTVAAFIPMLYITGNVGLFTRGMPMTLMFSLTGSLAVALTAIPLLCYALWKSFPPKAQIEQESRVLDFYTELAKGALRNRWVTLLLAVAAFSLSLAVIPRLGLQLFPEAEKPFFLVDIRLPRQANLQSTSLLTEQVEEILARQTAVRDFTANIGKGSPLVYYNVLRETDLPSYAQILVNLQDEAEVTVDDLVPELQRAMRQIGGASVEPKVLEQGPQEGADIQLRIFGNDLETLALLAQETRRRIASVPGLTDVQDTLGEKIPRLELDLDKEKAGRLGIDTFSFSSTVFMALNGTVASQFLDGDEEVPMVVRLDRDPIREVSDLGQLYLPSGAGDVVPFSEVAQVHQRAEFARISRRDGRRMVVVEADVSGRLVNDALKEIQQVLAAFSLPDGYELEYGGENEARDKAFAALGRALLAALLLIYAILAIQFNSFTQPFVILLTVPFGIIGAVIGLLITGNPFGFMAFIGIVSLTGIIVNDSIVLADFANYLQREQGKHMYEALLEAGRMRFRPVILTSITTIAGMTPLAIWGGSLWSPLACALIFGLVGSTILILLVLPVIYSMIVGHREAQRQYRVLPRLWQRVLRKETVPRIG